MLKTNHTPGPWKIAQEEPYFQEAKDIYPQVQISGDGMVVAEIPFGKTNELKDEAWANARLIAAAPELLEALKQAVKDCSCTLRERESGHHVDCRAPEWEKIIAKAEGSDAV